MAHSDRTGRQAIAVLISARGGGGLSPVIALAAGSRDRGHDVHVLCDGAVGDSVRATGLPVIQLPRECEQDVFYSPYFLE